MVDKHADLREVALHPRHCQRLVGHDAAVAHFARAFSVGTPHHAWLITGPAGIGKASFAYGLTRMVLCAGSDPQRTSSWLSARAHPDFQVLELAVSDPKTGKLRSEISVEDVHAFAGLFARTSGQGGWRVGLVDCADQLNREGANALLKLVEEPPDKSLIFIISHQPGRVLRTLRSRCLRLPLQPLLESQVEDVLAHLPLEDRPEANAMKEAARLSRGSPGRALELLNSAGAMAYRTFLDAHQLDAATRHGISSHFTNRATINADYQVFMDLVIGWSGNKASQKAASSAGLAMAQLNSALLRRRGEVEGYNLDRRVAVLEALSSIQDALKAG